MKFCAARKPGLYRRIGIACHLNLMNVSDAEADRATIGFVSEFLASLGLATKLREHGVEVGQLEALIDQAVEDPCYKTNAVPVSRENFRELYGEVL